MKTKTEVFKSEKGNEVSEFIDELYDKYGDRVVNLTMDGGQHNFILFYTIQQDEPPKQEQNID